MNEFWKDKRVLVTGNDGFIGRSLCSRLLSMGAVVSGIDQYKDVRVYEHIQRVMIEKEPEIVFHLAAQSLVEAGQIFPKLTIETNVMGVSNLLEACRTLNW